MTILDQVSQALQNAWNWFTSIGASTSEALTGIGVWIYQGLIWLASILGQWLGSGLAWIASGIAWLGNQLYNLGQWLWNGILWLGSSIINAFKAVFEWLYGIVVNVFNTVVGWVGQFVNFFNNWITSLIVSFRGKLKHLIMYNISMTGIKRSITSFAKDPNPRSLIALFASPIIGAVTAEIMDKLIPVPATQTLQVFPWFALPQISISPISIPQVTIPQYPERGEWLQQTVETGVYPPEYTGAFEVSVKSGTGSTISATVIEGILLQLEAGTGNTVSTTYTEPFVVYELSEAGNTIEAKVYESITLLELSEVGNTVTANIVEILHMLVESGAGSVVEAEVVTTETFTATIIVEEVTAEELYTSAESGAGSVVEVE